MSRIPQKTLKFLQEYTSIVKQSAILLNRRLSLLLLALRHSCTSWSVGTIFYSTTTVSYHLPRSSNQIISMFNFIRIIFGKHFSVILVLLVGSILKVPIGILSYISSTGIEKGTASYLSCRKSIVLAIEISNPLCTNVRQRSCHCRKGDATNQHVGATKMTRIAAAVAWKCVVAVRVRRVLGSCEMPWE